MKSFHEDEQKVVYSCAESTFTFLKDSKLMYHVESVHEGFVFTCELCDFKANTKHELLEHIKTFHLIYFICCHRKYKKKKKILFNWMRVKEHSKISDGKQKRRLKVVMIRRKENLEKKGIWLGPIKMEFRFIISFIEIFY